MLRLKSLSLVNQRRTLRALYANTQGWPHACTLDANFVRTSGGMLALGSPVGQAAIFPGAPMQLNGDEQVTLEVTGSKIGATVSTDTTSLANTNVVLGLSANYVGGTMDELGDFNMIGVWRGRGATFEVLAPVFAASQTYNVGQAVVASTGVNSPLLTANGSGQLSQLDETPALATSTTAVARVINTLGASANAIIIELRTP